MDEAEARRRFAAGRVGHLATVGADGHPGVVPCCFAVEGDALYTAVDHKPKRSPRLRRLDDVAAHPEVALVVDHWSEEWEELWWVRARGSGRVVAAAAGGSDADGDRAAARRLLAAKYAQYRDAPPAGAVIVVRLVAWRWWSGAPGGS
ncbi:MAG: TIGR03668 family PPOX class F420-dependent oxidoreductase [Acidimicrobiales bacterium]